MTFALQASVNLRSHGIEPIIYATDLATLPMARSETRMTRELAPYGANRLDLRLGSISPPRRLANSWRMWLDLPLLTRRVDLVHIHSLWLIPQLVGYLSARFGGVPYVVSPHGALDPYLRGKGRVRKWVTDAAWQRGMLRRAAALHVTTEEERALIADVAPGVPRFVVPVGIDVSDYLKMPDRSAFRVRHLDGHDGAVLLFLGRVTFKKGLDVLIRGFAASRPERTDALLAIVGPDDEGLTPRLERLAGELGVASRVRFVGGLYGAEKLSALAASDAWILTSHTENFGVSVLEAAAAGLPIIVSPQVNLAAALTERDAAVVVELDAGAVGAAIGDLLSDQPRRSRLATAARGFAAGYDWSAVSPILARNYREVVARSCRVGGG